MWLGFQVLHIGPMHVCSSESLWDQREMYISVYKHLMKASSTIDRNPVPGGDTLRSLKYIFFYKYFTKTITVNQLLFAMTLFCDLP